MDCNCDTIVRCSSTACNSNRSKKLKNTIDCHDGVNNRNITDALPQEIMMLILNKLDMVEFHCFSAVCRSWQSIAIAAKKIWQHLHLRPQPPWLIFSSLENDHIMCFSLSHGKVFRFKLPEVYGGAQCCGSNRGWLIMMGKIGRNFLLNPFTRVLIELPQKATLPDFQGFKFEHMKENPNYIRKAMLLSLLPAAAAATTTIATATDKSIWVVIIYCCHQIAFCRLGDKTWTDFGYYKSDFEDIVFYDGKLYAITTECALILVELDPYPKATMCNIAPPEEEYRALYQIKSFYLVECVGELLVVVRFRKSIFQIFSNTNMFKIFKVDPKRRRWIKVEDLGDQMLFIGTSTGFSLSSLDYPGFRGNRIYFTDDYYHHFSYLFSGQARCHDLGVFHLKDNSIEPFYSNDHSSSFVSPSIWFTPISW